jgi:hypothetical protein
MNGAGRTDDWPSLMLDNGPSPATTAIALPARGDVQPG